MPTVNKKNIEIHIIANSTLEPGMSGGTRILIELARGWVKRGVEVVIHTSKTGKDICDQSLLKGVNYILWPGEKFAKYNMFATYFVGTIYNCFQSFKWKPCKYETFVWSSSDFWPDNLPGLIMKLRWRKKVFWIGSVFLFPPNPLGSLQDFKFPSISAILHYLTQKPVYFLTKKYSQMIFVTNDGDRDMVIKETGRSKEEVVAIRGGVDLRFIQSIPEQPKKYLALFMGRVHRHKGILELMDIWRMVVDKRVNAKLAILGEGPQMDELKGKIKNLGLQDNVDLFGFVDGQKKFEIVKSCKMFLHSSVVDSGGMTGAESMAAGLPNIGYNLPAFVTYYPKGMLKAPIGDQKAFADLILKLDKEKNLYEDTKVKALDWAKGWDWDDNAERVLRLMKTTIKN